MRKLFTNRISSPLTKLPALCRRLAVAMLAITMSLGATQALAQQTVLKGTVRDGSGNPVTGATVTLKGTANGTATDAKGEFTLTAPVTETSVLVVSYLGSKPQEIAVGSRRQFDVSLSDSSAQIDEVVVTGFQNINKANFTGASTKVMADDVKVKGVIDVSRMLEGQVAGVSIQNVSSTFGAAPKVRIRGATSINGENKPLWVIDGVVHEDMVNISNDELTSGDPATLLGSAVAGLNPSDIESMDVLKDASAISLYGARAMNGVIVVTTKRGKIDEKPVIKYSGNFSVMLKPTYANYDIMTSDEQMSVYSELDRKGFFKMSLFNRSNWGVFGKMYKNINTWDESAGRYALENTQEAKEDFLRRYASANTDWFDVLFRHSLVQEHSLSISSGSAKSRLYGSLSFLNDQGWSVADAVQRYTANLRQDITVGRFNLGYQVVGSVRQQEAPGSLSRKTNLVEGGYDREFDINPFSYALNTSRALTPYDENGNLEYFQRNYAPFNILEELDNNRIHLNVIDFKMQAESSFKIMKGMTWDLVGAYRYVKSDREHRITEHANMANAYRAADTDVMRKNNRFLYEDPATPGMPKVIVLPYGGIYNRNEDQLSSIDLRNSINYRTSICHKHNINALVGQQIKSANRQVFSNTGYGYQYDRGGTIQLDYRIMKQMIESNFDYYRMSETRDRFAAFYAKADYDYDKRYAFTANVRYDGSNSLGKSTSARWLPTWGVSGKWNISEEPYMRKHRWLSYASLRGSYGLVATMPPAANASAIFLDKLTNRPYTEEKEGVIVLDELQNDELTWEKSYLGNIGLDLGLLDRRLEVVVDAWRRQGFDLISTIRVSGIGGDLTKLANYADMDSYGVDVSVSGSPIQNKNFKWRMSFTLGYNHNEITYAQNKPRIFDMVTANGGNLQGYPVKSLFSINYAGLDDKGVPLFINESGSVSNAVYMQSTTLDHLIYEGPVDPPYAGGFSNTFNYKGLSLNIFLTFAAGNKIRLAPAFKWTYSDLDAMSRSFHDRWLMAGDQTKIPAIVTSFERSENYDSMYPFNNYNYSTERVARGDFIRVKTLSLTYNIPPKLLQKTRVFSNISATLAGSNLFMLYQDKKLNGQDPEFYNSGGVAQPLQKQITFALSVSF